MGLENGSAGIAREILRFQAEQGRWAERKGEQEIPVHPRNLTLRASELASSHATTVQSTPNPFYFVTTCLRFSDKEGTLKYKKKLQKKDLRSSQETKGISVTFPLILNLFFILENERILFC